MTHSEQLIKYPPRAARKTAATPSSGQGGGDGLATAVAVSAVASTPCDGHASEYFIKSNLSPSSRLRSRRGQPPRLTARLKRFLGVLVSLGMSRRRAARLVGIDQSTITRGAQRDPDFARTLAQAVQQRLVRPQVGAGNWRALARQLGARRLS